jgi:hypothetical protein
LGKGEGGAYNVMANDGTPHVVFQFQNVPVERRMNKVSTNTGGYAASEMRAYLTGNFLAGLTVAGVPDSVLWAPMRYVVNGGSGANNTVTDKLWLPTEREMLGSRTSSDNMYETAANQARLEYYGDNDKRKKYKSGSNSEWYWAASPAAPGATSFCYVNDAGLTTFAGAIAAGGCAPAFCVK